MARSANQRYFAGLSKNTFLLACSSLFADISTEMFYPVLPVFMTQTLKASGSIVGLVDGFAQATQNIMQGFSGALSDKLQERKSIALAGYLMGEVAKPFMGLSTIWQGVFGARLMDRLGADTRSAPLCWKIFARRSMRGVIYRICCWTPNLSHKVMEHQEDLRREVCLATNSGVLIPC